MNINHLAIICDGNRTWARNQGKPEFYGHTQGAKNIKSVVKAAIDRNVKNLTLFLLSTENLLNRSQQELSHLFSLFSQLIDYEELFHSHQIKFNTVGDTTKLPQNIQEALQLLKEKTKEYKNLTLTFAVNYGGRDEIIRAAQKFKDDKTGKSFDEFLDSYNLPDIDILIRTGGFQRISNFLLWKLAYAELFFTEKRWPEFSESDLDLVIDKYQNIHRKFGK